MINPRSALVPTTRLMTVAQVADVLGYSALTVRRMIRDGRLPALDIAEGSVRDSLGRPHPTYRVESEVLRAYLAGKRFDEPEADAGEPDEPAS